MNTDVCDVKRKANVWNGPSIQTSQDIMELDICETL